MTPPAELPTTLAGTREAVTPEIKATQWDRVPKDQGFPLGSYPGETQGELDVRMEGLMRGTKKGDSSADHVLGLYRDYRSSRGEQPFQHLDRQKTLEANRVYAKQLPFFNSMFNTGFESAFPEAERQGISDNFSAGPMPDVARKVTANKMLVSEMTGIPADRLESNWAATRTRYAKQAFGFEGNMIDDEQFHALAGKTVGAEWKNHEHSNVYARRARAGVAAGRPLADVMKGVEDKDFQRVIKQTYAETLERYSDDEILLANKLYERDVAKAQGEYTKPNEENSKAVEDKSLERQFTARDIAGRDRIRQLMAYRMQEDGYDVQGFFQKTYQATAAGADRIGQGLLSGAGDAQSKDIELILQSGVSHLTEKELADPDQLRGYAATRSENARNPRYLEGVPALTPEARKILEDQRDQFAAERDYRGDMATAGLRIARSLDEENDGFWMRATLQAYGSLPEMGLAVLPMGSGLPAIFASRRAEARSNFQRSAPDASPEEIDSMANATALGQTATLSMERFILGARLPRVGSVLKNAETSLANFTARGGWRTAAGIPARAGAVVGFEMIQENVENIVPDIVQAVGSALSEDIAGVDFGKVYERQRKVQGDIFGASLIFGMFAGTGRAIGDFVEGPKIQRAMMDTQGMRLTGIDPAKAQEISELAETNPLDAAEAYREAFQNTPDETLMANASAESRRIQARAAESEAQARAFLPEIVAREDGKTVVRWNDLTRSEDVYDSPEDAATAIQDRERDEEIDASRFNRAEIQSLTNAEVARVADALPPQMTVNATWVEPQSLAQWAGDSQQRIEQARERIRIHLGNAANDMGIIIDDADPRLNLNDYFIQGSSRNFTERGMTQIAVELADGTKGGDVANPLTAIEEIAEGVSKHLRDVEGVSIDRQIQWVRTVEQNSGRSLMAGNTSGMSPEALAQSVDEALSTIAQGYAVGRVTDEQVPSGLLSFLKAFKAWFTEILKLAKDIRSMRDRGLITEDFQRYLDISSGFSEQESVSRAATETNNTIAEDIRQALADQGVTFAIGRKQPLDEPLKGLSGKTANVEVPGRGVVKFGPFPAARQVAENYMRDAGLVYDPPVTYQKVDKARARKIAAEYAKMEHAPDDPLVKIAYRAMIDETVEQYKAILKYTNLDIEANPPGFDPYAASPRLAVLDVVENNHLWFFPTDDGFGSSEADISGNPLLEPTGLFLKDGRELLANDVFRIVHDYFGHIKEGVGFRADGEEQAWRMHSAMYSPLARLAMTSETRGQNSWVNFGPFGEANQKAGAGETVFADQKTGLLPEWIAYEGAGDPVMPDTTFAITNKMDKEYMDAVESGDDSKAQKMVDDVAKSRGYDSENLLYHGSTHEFTEFTRDRANVANDWGKGYYFTNNDYDAERNYHGDGPDLTQRIEYLAEQIEQNDDLESDEAMAQAREILVGEHPDGRTMEVYVRLQNPVVFGGEQETFFGYNYSYDEDLDEYGDPEGSLADLMDVIRGMDMHFDDLDLAKLEEDIMSAALDNEGISASDLEKVIRNSEGAMYAAEEDTGEMAIGEFMRRVFEDAGYDGIVDHNVSTKFKNMDLSEGDIHTIAFFSNQIKSAATSTRDEDGDVVPLSQRFNPQDNRITFSISQEEGSMDSLPYEVYDRQTGEVVWKGTYKQRVTARKVKDRRDNKYGGYRFATRFSTDQPPTTMGIVSGSPLIDYIESQIVDPQAKADIWTNMKGRIEDIAERARTTTPSEWISVEDQEAALVALDEQREAEVDRHEDTVESLRAEGLTATQDARAAMMSELGNRYETASPTHKKSLDRLMRERARNVQANVARKIDAENATHKRNLAQLDAKEKAVMQAGRRADRSMQRFQQLNDIATLEAIGKSLPPAIRGSVIGSFRKLSEMPNAEKRQAYLLDILGKVEKGIETHLVNQYQKAIRKRIRSAQPKVGDSRTAMGKIGAEGHDLFQAVEAAMAMTPEESDLKIEEISNKMDGGSLSMEEMEQLDNQMAALELFYDFENAGSARLEEGLDFLNQVYADGRREWLEVLQSRADRRDYIVSTLIRGLGRTGGVRTKDRAVSNDTGKGFLRKLDEMVMGAMLSGSQTLRRLGEMTDDPEVKLVIEEMERAFADAEIAEAAGIKRDNEAVASAMRQIFKVTTDYGLAKKLHELQQTNGDIPVTKIEGAIEGGEIKIPLEFAEAIAMGQVSGWTPKRRKNQISDPESVELTEDQIELVAAEWERFNELPEEDQKGVRSLTILPAGTDGSRESLGPVTQLEGLQFLLTMNQPDQVANLEKIGYDEQTKAELEAWLKPEVKAFGEWMVDYLKGEQVSLDAIHRAEKGVGLGLVENYFPIRKEVAAADLSNLDLNGLAPFQSGRSTGFLKARVDNVSEIAMANAVGVFLAHRAQVNFWKAHVSAIREWGSVISNEKFASAVRASMGNDYYKSLTQLLKRIEGGGRASAQQQLDFETTVKNLMKGFAVGTLGMRMSTLLVNTSAVLNATYEIPAADLMKGVALVVKRPEAFKDAWNSPAIKRRLEDGASFEAQLAKAKGLSSNPVLAVMNNVAQPAMNAINVVDTVANTASAAVVWEYTRNQGLSNGMTDEQARAAADQKVDDVMRRAAQPTLRLSKSEIEQRALENPMMALFALFISEPRKNFAITYLAGRQLVTGKGTYTPAMAMQQLLVGLVLYSAAEFTLRAAYAAFVNAKPDEEEDAWKRLSARMTDGKAWGYKLTTGHLTGVPLWGAGWDEAMKMAWSQPQFSNSQNPLIRTLQQLGGAKAVIDDEKTTSERIDGGIRVAQGLGSSLPGGAIASQLANVFDFLKSAAESNGVDFSEEDQVARYKSRFNKANKVITEKYGPTGDDKKVAALKYSAQIDVVTGMLQGLTKKEQDKIISELNISKTVEKGIKIRLGNSPGSTSAD